MCVEMGWHRGTSSCCGEGPGPLAMAGQRNRPSCAMQGPSRLQCLRVRDGEHTRSSHELSSASTAIAALRQGYQWGERGAVLVVFAKKWSAFKCLHLCQASLSADHKILFKLFTSNSLFHLRLTTESNSVHLRTFL